MIMAMPQNNSDQEKLLERITVLIVDDSNSIAESLQSILKSHHDLEVVGIARNAQEALSKAESLNPNIILMDAQMPQTDGVEATRQVKRQVPQSKIIFMAVHGTHVEDALAAGADDFIMKDAGRQELLQHIRKLGRRIEAV